MLKQGILAASLLAVSVTLASPSAQAQTPLKPEVSAHIHYGIGINGVDGVPTSYGFGFGARGGVSLPMGVYVGGLFDYNFGGSESTTFFGSPVDVSANSFVLAAEAGYDLGLGPVNLRPRLGVGLIDVGVDVGGSGGSIGASGSSLVFIPGASLLYDINEMWFVGGELSLFVPTENLEFNEKSLTIGIAGGVKF